jgi:hypothetical protein
MAERDGHAIMVPISHCARPACFTISAADGTESVTLIDRDGADANPPDCAGVVDAHELIASSQDVRLRALNRGGNGLDAAVLAVA